MAGVEGQSRRGPWVFWRARHREGDAADLTRAIGSARLAMRALLSRGRGRRSPATPGLGSIAGQQTMWDRRSRSRRHTRSRVRKPGTERGFGKSRTQLLTSSQSPSILDARLHSPPRTGSDVVANLQPAKTVVFSGTNPRPRQLPQGLKLGPLRA